MTLDEQFPAAAANYETDDRFIKRPVRQPCAHCRKPTAWFHLPLSVHLCCRDCFAGYATRRLRARSHADWC